MALQEPFDSAGSDALRSGRRQQLHHWVENLHVSNAG